MRSSNVFLIISLTVLLLATNCAQAQWSWSTDAMKYDDCHLVTPDLQSQLQGASDLAGKKGWALCGWFEYKFSVPQTGWYVLSLKGGDPREFFLDPHAGEQNYTYTTSSGNLFMNAGSHTLRIQTDVWVGMPKVTSLTIRQSNGSVGQSFRAVNESGKSKFQVGSDVPVTIYSGARASAAKLNVVVKDAGGVVVHHSGVLLPASQGLNTQKILIPATGNSGRTHGSFTISFADGESPVESACVQPITYDVIDTSSPKATGDDVKRTLIETIDCATQAPDYAGGTEFHGVRTRVVTTALGAYRESGLLGYRDHEDSATPNWFAYTLGIGDPQQPYMIEVDYPDDALRNFVICLRESDPGSYPLAGGVDCGGEYSLSNSMQTQTLLFTPRAAKPRIVFLNVSDGCRAAVARIRVYRIDGHLPAMASLPDSRMVMNWYEEGENFRCLWGAPSGVFDGFNPGDDYLNTETAAARWAEAAAYMGVDTLVPCVSVYSFVMYPSFVDKSFGLPTSDDALGEIILNAQARRIKVIPEFHVRPDELAWNTAYSSNPAQFTMCDLNGHYSIFCPPSANPIFPANQQWYLDTIGEVADRYKDSPAMAGVCLRMMDWVNPTLDNYKSLDWGYDDYTIGRYKSDTGSAVSFSPGDGKFHARHDWILANEREQWISWRCRQIAQILSNITARVRKARSDMVVYATYFGGFPADPREAGIDLALLRSVPGLVMVDAQSGYGRMNLDSIESQMTNRDYQINPSKLHAFHGDKAPGWFLDTQRYIEGTEAIVPPVDLGFSPTTKKTWVSGDTVPAGRHDLERYAVALAETDAFCVGDGGNGYTIGQPVLRGWMREYRNLPEQPFKLAPGASDPVVVRTLKRGDAFLFYAVNRERYQVQIEVSFKGLTHLRRLSTGQRVTSTKGQLSLTLDPYELLAYTANVGASITDVRETIPAKALNQVVKQVQWLVALNKTPPPSLTDDQVKVIGNYASQALAAIKNKQYWLARTIFERPELLQVFRGINTFPPDLYAPENLLYEADDMTLAGGAQVQDSQPAGAHVITGLMKPGASATIDNLQGDYGGLHKIVVHYQAGSDLRLAVVANDGAPVMVELPSSAKGQIAVEIPLRPRGSNRVKFSCAGLVASGQSDGLSISRIEVK